MGSTVTVEVKDEAEAYAVKYCMENEFLALLKKEREEGLKEFKFLIGIASQITGNEDTFVSLMTPGIQKKIDRRSDIFTLKQHSGIANLIQSSIDIYEQDFFRSR